MKQEKEKFAFGGETNPKHETLSAMENNPSAGFADGGEVKKDDSDNGTLVGLRELLRAAAAGESSSPVKDVVKEDKAHVDPNAPAINRQMLADGGDVSDADATAAMIAGGDPSQSGLTRPTTIGPTTMPLPQPQISPWLMSALSKAAAPANAANAAQLGLQVPSPQPAPMGGAPQGMPPVPPQGATQAPAIQQILQKLQQTPNTNYDFYKNMNAGDRAALLQKLTAQQHSGGNLAASAAGGLGDAIARSYGHQNTNYQNDIEAKAQSVKEQAIGAMDTERAQKMQDMSANMALQENDPTSPYSSGMRQFVTSFTGKQVPSGVSASMLKANFGDIAKIFDSQVHAATEKAGQKVEAGKAVAGQTLFQRVANALSPNVGEKSLEDTAGNGAAPASGSGWSVVK